MATLVDSIVNKAISDIWQRPNQDRAARFTATPITGYNGALSYVTAWRFSVHLPDSTNRYVVYDLGQLNPNLYGFDEYLRDWKRAEEICNKENMLMQILVNNRRIPLKHCFFYRNEHRTTMVAIDVSKCKGLINYQSQVYISFYSNNWLNSADGQLTDGIEVIGYDVIDDAVKSNTWSKLLEFRAKPGNTTVYINGLFCDIVSINDITVGDFVELTNDASGTGFFDIRLSAAPFFLSELDSKGKYLLLSPDNANSKKYCYLDDINIVVYNNFNTAHSTTYPRGVVYDLFNESDIRMVTHRDYSIDSVKLKNILKNQKNEVIMTNAIARVYYRTADSDRPFPYDGQYINDMYLFTREERKSFMVGTNSVIDEWKAANLEKSNYTLWMGMNRFNLSYEKAKDVYSYHGLYKMSEELVKDGTRYILPPIAFKGGAVFKHDVNGVMQGIDYITEVDYANGFYNLPVGIEYIEFVPGKRAVNAIEFERSNGRIDNQGEYAEQYFIRTPDNQWLVAEEGLHYTVNKVDYTIEFDRVYDTWPKIKRLSGVYYINEVNAMANVDLTKPIPVFTTGTLGLETHNPARVDIWLNGRRLIKELDYRVNFPNVTIHNVTFAEDLNNVVILTHGLPNDKDNDDSFGFIENGYLNYDERYKLDFNRPVDIICDGRLGVREKMVFSESRIGTTDPIYREGAPYKILKPLTHIPIIYRSELTKSRSEGLLIDSKIEDFLSTLGRETILPVNNVISTKHTVLSYTLVKLIEDLNSGKIRVINNNLSDAGVASIMLGYAKELENDIGTSDKGSWKWKYITLAAHNRKISVGVSSLHYSFLEKVNKLFFSSRCQLNNYLHVV